MPENEDITELLQQWNAGRAEALDELMPLVYRELQLIAHRYLRRESDDHTLQTTALVNEAYLKMVDQTRANWENRAQFFGVAAEMMRRILIDHARGKLSRKRGAGAASIALDVGAIDVSDEKSAEILLLDEALVKLAKLDRERARVVELRYFGGLSVEETAAATGTSVSTVMRQWRVAKAWLYRELAATGE